MYSLFEWRIALKRNSRLLFTPKVLNMGHYHFYRYTRCSATQGAEDGGQTPPFLAPLRHESV